MVKKKLHYLSAALIIAMLIFLITDLDLIAPPKMESGNENLRIDVSHIHNLASSSVQFPQAVREVMATMSYNPLKQKDNTFQGEDIRTTSFNKTLFQGEDRKDLLYTSGGYLLSHDYWEQLTAGSRSLSILQCWAKRLNMSVVEPFVKKTDLYSPTGDQEVESLLKFSDVLDLDHWNVLSQKANYSSLIPWEHFIERAPRNLITVNMNYGATKQEPRQEEKLYRHGCTSNGSWNRLTQFLEQKYNFTVVRRICINFSYNKEFGLSEFYEEIFGGNKPSHSTVLFRQWRGLSNRRIQVRGSGCGTPTANLDAEPSKQVLQDAQKYTEKYLKTRDYVAIFARMEKAKQQKNQQGMVTNCFHETLESWRLMVSTTGLNTTFLSADVGRLGSGSFKMAKDDLNRAFSDFFTALYGDKLTVREWEATFESISGMSHSGYIGILQKVLASQAKCVLFVGGGSFQKNALKLYRKTHAKKDWCIYIIKDCTVAKLYEM